MTDYHNPTSCNKCGGLNEIVAVDYVNGRLSEPRTYCRECGYKDYWAFGYFESGSEMESKCNKYNFDSSQKL